MKRASPDDWLRAGLGLVRERGPDALTIDALCRALGLTKGSFYHHFADIDAYQERLLDFWELASTAAPIADADLAKGGADRRRRLYDAVARIELRVERAIQAWALHDPRARVARARVDERRLAYLARIWEEEGATQARARMFAQIEYASFLGSLSLYDLDTGPGTKKARELSKQVVGTLRRELVASAASSSTAPTSPPTPRAKPPRTRARA